MDMPLRRTLSLMVGAVLLLAATVTWTGRRGTDDIANAAAASPYGEMTIHEFKGQQNLNSEIRDHEWEATATYTVGGGSGTASGRAIIHHFFVTRSTTAASPAIAAALVNGIQFPRVTVRIFKPGTDNVAGLFVLKEVKISRLHESPGTGATEVIGFVYDEIDWTQNGGNFCWNLEVFEGCLN